MQTQVYQTAVAKYKNLSRQEERQLIKLAQAGDEKAFEELILGHIGFFQFRIKTILFPNLAKRYGDDILQECLLLATKKVRTFDLCYRNKKGRLKPVYFRTYLWKAVTGLILQFIKKYKNEIMFSDLSVVDIALQKEDMFKASYVYNREQNQ